MGAGAGLIFAAAFLVPAGPVTATHLWWTSDVCDFLWDPLLTRGTVEDMTRVRAGLFHDMAVEACHETVPTH
jgi:hypothetical protein